MFISPIHVNEIPEIRKELNDLDTWDQFYFQRKGKLLATLHKLVESASTTGLTPPPSSLTYQIWKPRILQMRRRC